MPKTDKIVSTPTHIAQHRARRGWSQSQLAEQSAVSRTEISAIETGRVVPSVAVALRLASTLGESVETLFGMATPLASARWAWPAPAGEDTRMWRATVDDRVLAFPVEPTAAGAVPHDATLTATGLDIVPDARPDRTLVIAGCDPLVGFVVREMSERHDVRMLPLSRSSTEAVMLLQQGLVHVAGVHLTDARGRSTNDRAVRSMLGRGHSLLHQMRWETGVALSPHRRERTVRELMHANLRWVNREEGSAARRTFDALLGSHRRPRGYARVVRDHRAVAATVSSGWAEAGICVRPAAAEAHLAFVPLQQEAYELCVADALLDDPRVTALRAVLRSLHYRRLIGDVPGCVSSDTGEQRSVA
jgi:molybdate-binding protein/DNA-binding XRE family transcriptional regulator